MPPLEQINESYDQLFSDWHEVCSHVLHWTQDRSKNAGMMMSESETMTPKITRQEQQTYMYRQAQLWRSWDGGILAHVYRGWTKENPSRFNPNAFLKNLLFQESHTLLGEHHPCRLCAENKEPKHIHTQTLINDKNSSLEPDPFKYKIRRDHQNFMLRREQQSSVAIFWI